MKKISILITVIFVILASLLSSCTKSNNPNENEEIVYSGNKCSRYITFEESISAATDILRAEFVGIREQQSGMYDYLEFRPIEYIKDTATGENVFLACFRGVTSLFDGNGTSVNISYRESDRITSYKAGEEYLLILENVTTVYDDFDNFVTTVNAFIPKEDPRSSSIYADNDLFTYSDARENYVENYEELCRYVADVAATADTSVSISASEFVHSASLNDIASGSTYIFRVKALEKKYEIEENNSEGYTCLVTEELKGTAESQTIQVHFRKDSNVTPGKEYLILVTKTGDSVEYSVSSRNSVFPVTDTATVSQIETLIGDVAK